jgi:hypothetical protein
MNNTDATFVTAFIVNVNKTKSLEKYIELGKIYLQTDINKVVFMDETIIHEFDYLMNKKTHIIPFKKEDNYLYNYIDKIDKFELNTPSPDKDTLDYMFIMCNKTEWLRNAIELNIYNSNQFIWTDFGIRHVFSQSDEEFRSKMERLNQLKYDQIRIASIWNLDKFYQYNPYRDISWYFAGGVFGGSSEVLIKFADLMKDMCIEIIETHGTLMWEVNIWRFIYLNNRELFSPYYCDHNNSIIDHY